MRSELGLIVLLLASCGDKPAPAPAPLEAAASLAIRADAPRADAEIDAAVGGSDEAAQQTADAERELAAIVATLPVLYAPLFIGNDSRFPGMTMFELPLEIRENGRVERGRMRCFIGASVIPGAVHGGLGCNPFDMGGQVLLFTLDVELFATPAGLWMESFDFGEDASKLEPERMVIAADPKPKRSVRVDADGVRVALRTTQHGDTWCITAAARDRTYLCLRAGAGIVGGGGTGRGIGGSKRIERWGFVPPGRE